MVAAEEFKGEMVTSGILPPSSPSSKEAGEEATAPSSSSCKCTLLSTCMDCRQSYKRIAENEPPEDWPSLDDGQRGINYRAVTIDLEAEEVEDLVITEENVQKAFRLVQLLDTDTRLFLAAGLLLKLETYAAKEEASPSKGARWLRHALALPHIVTRLTEFKRRVALCRQASRDMVAEDWKVAHKDVDGITTYYRKDSDKTLAYRTSGEIHDCDAVTQLAVLREANFYHKWIPVMDKSTVVNRMGKIEQTVWFRVVVEVFGRRTGMVRDAVLHLFGCDASEEGKLILSGGSVPNEAITPEMGISPVKKKLGFARVDIKYFFIQMHFLSSTSAKIDLIYKVDPKIRYVPQPLINYFSKVLCGWVIWYLFEEIKRVQADPVENCTAKLMRSDPFYTNYLVPYLLTFAYRKGWEVPEVDIFEVDKDGDAAKAWREEHAAILAKLNLLPPNEAEGDIE